MKMCWNGFGSDSGSSDATDLSALLYSVVLFHVHDVEMAVLIIRDTFTGGVLVRDDESNAAMRVGVASLQL